VATYAAITSSRLAVLSSSFKSRRRRSIACMRK
jgi:hypothetical protein